MEEQILEMLTSMQKDVKDIKDTAFRLNASYIEDAIEGLKVDKKKTDFEIEYLHYRLTEMDKRIYALEKQRKIKQS